MEKNKTVLVLRVTSYQSHTLGAAGQKVFGAAGGSFGRKQGNDWVLPDPERFVSSQHGAIHFEGGTFFLTDKSTNGIFVDGQTEPVGKGNSVALRHGSTLRFADYEMLASIEVGDVGEFGDESLGESSVDLNSFDVSLEATGESHNAAPGQVTSPGFDPMRGATHATTNPGSGLGSDTSPGVYHDSASALNEAMPAQHIQHDSQAPIAEPPVSSTPLPGESSAATTGGAHLIIPDDDWDMTGFGAADTAAINTSEIQPDARFERLPVVESTPNRSPVPKPAPQGRVQQPAAASGEIPGPAAGHPQPSAPAGAPAAQAGANDLFGLLLAQLGLAAEEFSPAQKRQLAHDFGGTFRQVIEGLMLILRARAELKNEFRMSQTTIQPVENNPLKFSPNVDEALKTLLEGNTASYLDLGAAVKEGVDDIRNHQIAMIVGMQRAFADMIQRLDPANFIEDDTDSNLAKAALQSLNKKSRAWQKYADYYDETIVKSDNAFQILFGDDFSKAYEEQVQRLDTLSRKRK